MNKFLKLYKRKRIIKVATEDEFTLTKFSLCIKFHKELQCWTKGWRKIHKIKQNRFFYGMFYS